MLSTIDTSYDAHRNPIRARTSAAGTTLTVADSAYDDRGEQLCATLRMNAAVFGSLPTDACTLGTAGSQGPKGLARRSASSGPWIRIRNKDDARRLLRAMLRTTDIMRRDAR